VTHTTWEHRSITREPDSNGLRIHPYRSTLLFVKLRYRFRFYPSREQEKILARTFGACRYVYNWALRLRSDSYHTEGKSVNYEGTSAALTVLKKQEATSWLNEVSSVPTQQALRHLQTAFRNFFDKRAAYPSFRSKHGKQAAEYTRSGFKWDASTRSLKVAGLGRLNVRWSRVFKSDPTTATITKDCAGRYFVTLVLDETLEALPKTGLSVGVDLGINRLATLSNGERIHNPKHTRKHEKRLAKAQRILSRRKKGSGRWKAQKLKVARIQAHIADSRADHLNKVTTDLVRRFDVICVEDLNVRGMVKNHRLAKSVSDAGFGAFKLNLKYKCEWYGKTLREIDRWYPSSKRCSSCGQIASSMRLSVRNWVCSSCGVVHDRDENAALNILQVGWAEGHSVTGRGGKSESDGVFAHQGISRRNVNLKGSNA
jgi:putative transposase